MRPRLFEAAGIATFSTRQAWDAEVVGIISTMVDRWDLAVGRAFSGGYAATVLEVTRSDGSPAVLKVGYPHEEALAEAVALGNVAPGLAPRVLAQDAWTWSMLLERIDPGDPLSESDLSTENALVAGASLLARVSATGPVAGIPLLGDVVGAHGRVARSRSGVQSPALATLDATEVVGDALAELDALAHTGARSAFVHGDFNPGNILRSGEGWVMIDPKPMIGDPAYDLWPLVAQLGSPFSGPDAATVLGDAVTVAARTAGCEPVRATRWAFARCGLAVTWYLEEGDLALAAREVGELRVWATLLDRMTTGAIG